MINNSNRRQVTVMLLLTVLLNGNSYCTWNKNRYFDDSKGKKYCMEECVYGFTPLSATFLQFPAGDTRNELHAMYPYSESNLGLRRDD